MAGGGEGQAGVSSPAGSAPTGAVIIKRSANRPLRFVELRRSGTRQSTELDGQVALAERRDGVVVGIFAREFVGCAAAQMELYLALFRFGNDNRVLCQRQA